MDPCSFNINPTSELRLRRHIREVLLPYARMHLTSDHAAFSENVVEELLLQTLEYVPMADATSFLLPTDPFEVLMCSLDCLDLTPPEEKWIAPSQHTRYLRTFFPPPPNPQDIRSEKCWYEDDHYTQLSLIYKPISTPVLSRRARLETPRVGGTNSRASIPRTKSALKTYPGLNAVSDEKIEDPPAPAMDDVLCLRLEIDPATRTRVRQFIQSGLVPLGNEKSIDHRGRTPNIPEFLNRHSPPRRLPSLDSPPLFSRIACGRPTHRNARRDTEKSVVNPISVPELVPMLKVASPPEPINGEDGDINNHHMEVVSGWTTMKYSSPPPPSRHSSDGSEVDELWDVSPPGTPATSLVAAKMDEIEIPRIRKFGYRNASADECTNACATDLLNVAKSPGFFITSFISAPALMTQAQKPITTQLNGAESGMLPPRPPSPGQTTSNSLLEQPPSAAEEQSNEEPLPGCAGMVEDFEEERLDDAVASIYVSIPQDPFSYIREEKLDDKDIMLMDVPNLPPPTAHLRKLFLFPKSMQSFVSPKAELGGNTANYGGYGLGPTGFLKPVKGVKPLALDLSWRPFNFGKTIPTDEEVAGIAQPVQSPDEAIYHDEKYTNTTRFLLDLGISLNSAEIARPILIPKSPRGCEGFGMSPTPKRAEFESGHVEYLLTQRERNRAFGANTTLETEDGVQADAGTGQHIPPSTPNDDEDVVPERNYYFQDEEQPDSRNPFDFMECVSRSDHGFFFDGSGLDIVENNIYQFSTNEFGIPQSLLVPPPDSFMHAMDPFEANKENISINLDHPSENKDVPPVDDTDDCQLDTHQNDPLTEQLDWNGYFQFPESQTTSFEPLSFASQSQLPGPSHDFTNSKEKAIPASAPAARDAKYNKDDFVSTSEFEGTTSRATKRRKLDNLVPASSMDLFSTFIGLRNKATLNLTLQESEIRTDTSVPEQIPDTPEQFPLPRVTPDDVFDQRTVRLPEHWVPAAVVHRYLASMALIQKRALVRDLQGHLCRIVLVERYDLGGTDVVIDPDYGVLFVPLLALPAHVDPTMERISHESWRYSNLLIVFEAYPSAQSYRADRSHNTRSVPYAYTPPICKAIGKLRRNLGISEGCGTLDSRCALRWAFANDVEEAAKFVRCFGEEAFAMSSERGQGGLWDQREWLEEEREGESDLAAVHGMNAFAAFIILYDSSLEAILEMSPEARLANFGPLLGQERMTGLNALIESKMQQIAPDAADSVIDPVH